jgi:hypothetical protein
MEPEDSSPYSQQPATCPYPQPDRSSLCPPHPTSQRSILILSSHLRLGLPSGLPPSGFLTEALYTPLLSSAIKIIYKHLIYTSQRRNAVFIRKTEQLKHFRETPFFSNRNKHKLCRQNVEYLNVIACSTHIFHCALSTRWFKYDRNKLWLVYTQIVPVIFEPPCT